MGLNARGMSSLALVPGLMEAVKQHGVRGSGSMLTVSADGSSTHRGGPVGGGSFRLLRAGLLEGMKEFVQALPNVDARYGVTTESIEFDGDEIVVKYFDGEDKVIRTRCLIACDGRQSFVARQVDGAIANGMLHATNGIGETQYWSSSTNIRVRSFVMDESVLSTFPVHASEKTEDRDTRLLGANKGWKKGLHFIVFCLPARYKAVIGGVIGSVPVFPGNESENIRSVEDGYAMFERNFPALDVRKYVSEESMKRYVEVDSPKFGTLRHRNSLTCTSAAGGVVFLGDAAHSFPPDLGLGVNTSLEDAAVFAKVIDEGGSLEDVLRKYESVRSGETRAVVKLHQSMAQFQYGHVWGMRWLATTNAIVRTKLAKWWPEVFYGNLSTLLREGNFEQALAKANCMTRWLWALGVGVVGIVVLLLTLLWMLFW